ncbi:Oxysterol-binding protein, partial [Backusella circina FSU 941]
MTNDNKLIKRRTIIPHPAVEINISILGLLRKNLGKDLMTISLPVSINEPLSALQRQCEELEYSELLDTASEQTSSKERLLYVTAFAISGYASSQYRIGRKPFNPVLAETYECIRPDRGFRFIAEKVSHHPNCFAESNHFQFRQTVTGRTKFWGKSLEWIPEGSNHITLPKHNEHYTYTKPSSWVRNIVAGTRYLDHVGDMQVTNHATGEYAIVSFMESTGGGFFGVAKDRNNIMARFYNPSHQLLFKVTGKWSDILIQDQRTIWKVNPPALTDYKDYYGFTQYCMELNEVTELEKGKLPKTDTRHRPDQRFFENG